MNLEQAAHSQQQTLVYYQKPTIGTESGYRSAPPIQIIYPSGGFGLGIPPKEERPNRPNLQDRARHFSVLASGPERAEADILQLRGLQITFIILAVCNVIVTTLLIVDADVTDTSKVVQQVSPTTRIFEEVSSGRRSIEMVNYAYTVVLLVLGSIGCIAENALLLSGYSLGIVLNFILGTSALPYFVYSVRYILDVAMLYIALVLRSRCVYTVLPLHTHTN
mmetsp:Transcript_30940/g.52317  ORF Transcript_30940/g.52317 Transcript_30940/m.52317 type:complete len:221 (-) Transcript_30940:34-696(-)